MNDIYEKSKAQIGKEFRLPKPVRSVVAARIEGYLEYLEISKRDEKSYASEVDILNAIDAANIVRSVNNGLNWIDEKHRDAIWERAMKKTPWNQLKDKYYWSERTLRYEYQKFMYGVAVELGEIYNRY